jgi:hypothetical protein
MASAMIHRSRTLCLAFALVALTSCGVGTSAPPKSDDNETLKEQRRKSLPTSEQPLEARTILRA